MAYAFNDDKSKNQLATVATSGGYGDLLNKPSFANVATSGDYGDLLNKPLLKYMKKEYRPDNSIGVNQGIVISTMDYHSWPVATTDEIEIPPDLYVPIAVAGYDIKNVGTGFTLTELVLTESHGQWGHSWYCTGYFWNGSSAAVVPSFDIYFLMAPYKLVDPQSDWE